MQRLTIEQAMASLAVEKADYARLLCETSGDLGFYRPCPSDPQGPHLRDEVYIVASGHGIFACDGERHAFGPGDALFVPRAAEHRFEEFSEDFATWVIFLGTAPSRSQNPATA